MLASLPGLAIWSVDAIPVKLRALLVTGSICVFTLAVISKFLKILGLGREEAGLNLPRSGEIRKNVLLFLSGVLICLTWFAIYLAVFKMVLPGEYARVAALKSAGYLPFLQDWGRSGEFSGAVALCVSMFLLAIIEEVAFRGVLFSYMKREYSLRRAFFWNAGLFALIHMRLYTFPVIFVAGLVYTALRVKSGGIVMPVLVHFTYNVLLVYFGKYIVP